MDKIKTHQGGIRLGSGRKVGSGLYGEPTEVMRVPKSRKAAVLDFLDAHRRKIINKDLDTISLIEHPAYNPKSIQRPLFSSKVKAGLPSTADDHVEKRLDVADYLIDKIDSTFFVTISGESMRDAGLLSGDKAVVDRSKQASIGDIIMAQVDGEFTIKTLGKSKSGMPRLIPANPDFSVIEITEKMHFEIWGVVTGSFRKFR